MDKIKCTKCKEAMPKLRKDLYGYDFCVNCSDVMPKVGRIRVVGEGDYTATELDVLDQHTARRLQELENTSRGVRNNPLEILNYDEEEFHDDAKMLSDITDKVIKDEFKETTIDEDSDDEEELEEIDAEDLELDQDEE